MLAPCGDGPLRAQQPGEFSDILSPLMPDYNVQQNPPLLLLQVVIHTGEIFSTPTPLALSASQFNFNYIKSLAEWRLTLNYIPAGWIPNPIDRLTLSEAATCAGPQRRPGSVAVFVTSCLISGGRRGCSESRHLWPVTEQRPADNKLMK